LHAAAFFAHPRFVALLIEKRADVNVKNHDGKIPADNVAGSWSDGLAALYLQIGGATGMELNLERIKAAAWRWPRFSATLEAKPAVDRRAPVAPRT